jgi:hypothetical protein
MSIEQQRADVFRALHVSIFAVDNFVMEERSNLDFLSNAARTRLIVEAALAYLVGHGLIAVMPDGEWPDFVPMRVPPELKPDVDADVRRTQGLLGLLP